jgi:hypothetical protein
MTKAKEEGQCAMTELKVQPRAPGRVHTMMEWIIGCVNNGCLTDKN